MSGRGGSKMVDSMAVTTAVLNADGAFSLGRKTYGDIRHCLLSHCATPVLHTLLVPVELKKDDITGMVS